MTGRSGSTDETPQSPRSDRRLLGAALAAAVAAVLPLIQFGLANWIDIWRPDPVVLIAPLAVPIAALLGARHAPSVIQAPGLDARVILRIAAEAVVLGLLSIGVILAIANAVALRDAPWLVTPWSVIVGLVVTIVLGGLFVGAPVFAIASVIAFVWAAVFRWLVRRYLRDAR